MQDRRSYQNEHLELIGLLRDLREERHFRQQDVAQKLKLPQSFVSKYESGERKLDLIELRVIARILGKSLPEFVDLFERRLNQNHIQAAEND